MMRRLKQALELICVCLAVLWDNRKQILHFEAKRLQILIK